MAWNIFDTVTGDDWVGHNNAKDNDTDTYATGDGEVVGYLNFGLSTPKTVSKLRMWVENDGDIQDAVVDVDYGGGDWHNVYSGSAPEMEWVEIGVNHEIAVVRYNDESSGIEHRWVYEMQYEEAAAGASRPLVNSSLAGNILIDGGLRG